MTLVEKRYKEVRKEQREEKRKKRCEGRKLRKRKKRKKKQKKPLSGDQDSPHARRLRISKSGPRCVRAESKS